MHIYTLSRLYRQDATRWERKIRELREGRRGAFSPYRPLREAIIRLLAGDEQPDNVLIQMNQNATDRRERTVARNSLDFFLAFRENWANRFPTLDTNFMDQQINRGLPVVEYQDLILSGSPNFSAFDNRGILRYVYLMTSAWTIDELQSFEELLKIIIEIRYNANPSALWIINLLTGGRVSVPRIQQRVRNRLHDTIALFLRIRNAEQIEIEE